MTTEPKVIDFDTHVLEPAAVWQEYLEPEYRVLARSAFWHESIDGVAHTVLNGSLVAGKSAERGWVSRAAAWKPGRTWESIGQMGADELAVPNPGASNVAARLADMDAMGVDQAVLFPTYFGEYFPMVENPDLAEALARAYNNWIFDFCAAAPDRLLPAAVLPTQSVVTALRELRRVAERGSRIIMLRPVASSGRFLTDQYYEPLWQELESLGVLVALHPFAGSTNPEWSCHGPFVEKVAAKGSPSIGHPIAEAVAPLMDNSTFLIGFMMYGFLERFPELKIIFVHSKASWLPLFCEKIEGYIKEQFGLSFPVRYDADHVVLEHGGTLITADADEAVLPFLGQKWHRLMVWGSHYPNHDTMPATEAREQFRTGLPAEIVEGIMGGTARRLLGQPAVAGPA